MRRISPRGVDPMQLSVRRVFFLMLIACEPPPSAARPAHALGESTPAQESTPDDEHVALTQALEGVKTAMRPLCAPRCGSTGLAPDPSVEPGALCAWFAPEVSLIKYRPRARDCAGGAPHLRFYCVAHEYGHHLDVAVGGARLEAWQHEIRADVAAGCALIRAGRDVDEVAAEFSRAIALMTPEQQRRDAVCGADETHPSHAMSWAALLEGARACRDERSPSLADLWTRADTLERAARHRSAAESRSTDEAPLAPCAAKP